MDADSATVSSEKAPRRAFQTLIPMTRPMNNPILMARDMVTRSLTFVSKRKDRAVGCRNRPHPEVAD